MTPNIEIVGMKGLLESRRISAGTSAARNGVVNVKISVRSRSRCQGQEQF